MNKIELLLPAGNEETLKAAVENGADAVYLGIDKFNARRRATNFNLDNIKEVTDYCHKNGVKVYITMNILVKNDEIKDFFNTIKELYLKNVNAVIIQQISFLPIIKQNFPGLEVHISTQAAITNTYHAELIKQADKVVLPREFSKEEINQFIKKTNLPTEIFVQGALCFSYSGKCLFSSVIGGRSGNRGLCAQPCRRKYNNEYLLSMKDLCLIKKIPELIKMGVSSLKIEGRLRSVKYVQAATKLYRKAIDSYYSNKFSFDQELFKEMELAFNRQFTEGYFSECKDLVSSEKPMGRGIYLGTLDQNNQIKLEDNLSIGDGLGIWLNNKVDGAVIKKIEKDGNLVENAKKDDLVKLFIRAKSDTKIYKTSSVKKKKQISFTKNEAIKIKTRNCDKLTLPEISPKQLNKKELLVKVYSVNDAETALNNGADKVFYNIFADDFNKDLGAYVPRILTDEDVGKAVELIKKHNVKDVLVGNLGVYVLLKEIKDLNLYLDYDNNVFNDYDLDFFSQTTPIISPELSKKDLLNFKNKNFVVFAQGRVVIMNTKYESLPKSLKDEKHYTFPVRKEYNYYQILNSKELGLFEKVKDFSLFLDLDKDVEKLVKIYYDILNGKNIEISKKSYTKGHWEKGVI
jgi:collagenase-like PrtC family protease